MEMFFSQIFSFSGKYFYNIYIFLLIQKKFLYLQRSITVYLKPVVSMTLTEEMLVAFLLNPGKE